MLVAVSLAASMCIGIPLGQGVLAAVGVIQTILALAPNPLPSTES